MRRYRRLTRLERKREKINRQLSAVKLSVKKRGSDILEKNEKNKRTSVLSRKKRCVTYYKPDELKSSRVGLVEV